MTIVFAMREPVTIALAAEKTGVTPKAIRRVIEKNNVDAKACLVNDPRHPLVYELWEIQAALDRRDARRVVHRMKSAWG